MIMVFLICISVLMVDWGVVCLVLLISKYLRFVVGILLSILFIEVNVVDIIGMIRKSVVYKFGRSVFFLFFLKMLVCMVFIRVLRLCDIFCVVILMNVW